MISRSGRRPPSFTGSKQRGKAVLVNFAAGARPVAARCRRCNARGETQGGNFEMYAVNVGEDEDTIFGFNTPPASS
jgi:hypothetical protein